MYSGIGMFRTGLTGGRDGRFRECFRNRSSIETQLVGNCVEEVPENSERVGRCREAQGQNQNTNYDFSPHTRARYFFEWCTSFSCDVSMRFFSDARDRASNRARWVERSIRSLSLTLTYKVKCETRFPGSLPHEIFSTTLPDVGDRHPYSRSMLRPRCMLSLRLSRVGRLAQPCFCPVLRKLLDYRSHMSPVTAVLGLASVGLRGKGSFHWRLIPSKSYMLDRSTAAPLC